MLNTRTTTDRHEEESKNSKLVSGILLGAFIGGALTMIDSTTRNSVTTKSRNAKDSTKEFVTKVREQPSELKNDVQDRLKSATSVLKNAMNDAQNLYEKVNKEVVPQIDDIKESTSEMMNSAEEARDDLKDIGSQVADAGEEVTGNNGSSGSIESTKTSNPPLNNVKH